MRKVGLVYDPIYLEHDTGHHVENADRLKQTIELLESSGARQRLVEIRPRPASLDELLLVHSADHISRVQSVARSGGGWLDADTVLSPASYEVALHAAGGVMEATKAVMEGEVNSALALVRPPGHHATKTRAMGFCLFNNIAIAARHVMKECGLDRILIADFDVHHGNGTQDIFYDNPSVLFFSTHQYPFYPGTGSIEETGSGKGEGSITNVPLPARCGDKEYLQVFEQILIPAARRFQPQIILVSAGYDAHWADGLALMQVTTTGFAQMVGILTNLASELCQERLLFSLEGGYHLPALAHSIKATLEVLLGTAEIDDPLGQPTHPGRAPDIQSIIQRVKSVHNL